MTSDIDTPETTDRRVQRAVERELARQARTRKAAIALVAVAIVVSVMVLMLGNRERTLLKDNLAVDSEFTTSVARDVARAPDVADAVATSPAVQSAVTAEVRQTLTDDAVVQQIAASDGLQQQIASSAQAAFAQSLANGDLQSAIDRSTVAANETLRDQIADYEQRLAAMSNQVSSSGLADALTRIDALEREIEALREAAPAPDASSDLADARADIEELKSTVDALSSDGAVVGQTGPRSYLLKERSANALADIGLSITIGNERDGVVPVASVVDSSGTALLAEPVAARLGESLVLESSTGERLSLTFSYTQARFLARDYIGLELTLLENPGR